MLMNKNILVFGALSILAAAAPLAAQTDPTRPVSYTHLTLPPKA